jgi:hypothetical protein
MNNRVLSQDSGGVVVADTNHFPATGVHIAKTSFQPQNFGEFDHFTCHMTIRDGYRSERVFGLAMDGFMFIDLPRQNRMRVRMMKTP